MQHTHRDFGCDINAPPRFWGSVVCGGVTQPHAPGFTPHRPLSSRPQIEGGRAAHRSGSRHVGNGGTNDSVGVVVGRAGSELLTS
jgi:hypothetical protein